MIGKNNTVIIKEDGYLKVILHSTTIYKERDNVLILNNGGWVTLTTTRRMNQVLNDFGHSNLRVFRRNGDMYLEDSNSGIVSEFSSSGKLEIAL